MIFLLVVKLNMAGKSKAVSEEYKSALLDLNFNSKPMINVLTMLAEENSDYGQVIVQCICDRIKEVNVDQKMPALYLLDSILKNIGGEYVAIIAKHIVETFCCVFESAKDERKRMQLFKLRNTWTQYIPNKTLYELDVRICKTDPNWPIASPAPKTTAVQVSASLNNTPHQNMIHVNPKFLQKNDPAQVMLTGNHVTESLSAEKTNLEATRLQSKISKQRLLDEEKRVQEQLRLLQAEKLNRDREQHEMELKQQQLEREHLLAEQKRQLEVLRKQQQTMATTTESKNLQFKGQHQPSLSQPNFLKDPRLKNIPITTKSTLTREKLTSPTDGSRQFKLNSKGTGGALSVMSKIMTTLKTNTKPTAQQLAKERITKSAKRSPVTSPTDVKAPSPQPGRYSKNNKLKVSSTAMKPQPSSKNKPSNEGTSTWAKKRDNTESNRVSVPASAVMSTASAQNHVHEGITVSAAISSSSEPQPSVPPLPYSSAFTQLSTRDMQIAAQAAAIATAMHQMQSGINTTMAPEHSAMIAAQLIKVMQGSSPPTLPTQATTTVSSDIPTVVATTHVTSTTPPVAISTNVGNNGKYQPQTELKSLRKQDKLKDEHVQHEQRSDKLEKIKHISHPGDDYPNRDSRKDEFGRDFRDGKQMPDNDKRRNNKTHSNRLDMTSKQRDRGRERNSSVSEIGRDEPPSKRSKDNQDYTGRSRKARARSPSRYYCRVEKKMEVNKRVEEKEKQMILQRIRKTSGGEVGLSIPRKSEGDREEENLPDDLESIDLPEVGQAGNPKKTSLSVAHSLVKTEDSAGAKPDKMTVQEWEALKKIRKKEYIILNTKLLDIKRRKDERLDLGIFLKLKDEAEIKFKEGKLSKEQTDDLFDQIDLLRNEIKLHQSNEHLHWRSRQDMNTLSPMKQPHGGRNSPSHVRFSGPVRNAAPFSEGMPPIRNGPPPHIGQQPLFIRNDRPPLPNMRDGLRPPHVRDGPPQAHLRDAPQASHMWDGPPPHLRDGPPLHMRDGPPPHMRDGPPPHLREGPPSHMRDVPLPHMREGLPPHMRDGPRPHMVDGPQPHMRNGPRPPHMRDGPPRHMIDGPPPPHMRDGPLPPHMRDGPLPPYMRDGPPLHIRDRPMMEPIGPHMREGPPFPIMRDQHPSHAAGGALRYDCPDRIPDSSFPSHLKDGPRNLHMTDGIRGPQIPDQRHFRGPQPSNPPYSEPMQQEPMNSRSTQDGHSVNVSNLLGELFRAGILSNVNEELDLNAPQIKLQIDDLRKRHQAVINHLFRGLQCSSCGQRFSDDAKQQYREHLDWHFRQNRKEKDGDRKVSSRTWYYDVTDWIEQNERGIVSDDGKVQSDFFESEKTSNETEEVSNSQITPLKMNRKKVEDRSVPVTTEDGEAVCVVCTEPLEQFWDEDREEWRYAKSVRKNEKLYHYHCYTDYVPFEFEETTTPTPTRMPRFSLTDEEVKEDMNGSFLSPSDIKRESDVLETPAEVTPLTSTVKKEDIKKSIDSISEEVQAKNNVEKDTDIVQAEVKLEPPESISAESVAVEISREKEPLTKIAQSTSETSDVKVESTGKIVVKKEGGLDEEETNEGIELLDVIDTPGSPEYPVMSSTTPQSIPVSPGEPVVSVVTDIVSDDVMIGVKRRMEIEAGISSKERKLEDNVPESEIINVNEGEPCVTEAKPDSNKSDNEAANNHTS